MYITCNWFISYLSLSNLKKKHLVLYVLDDDEERGISTDTDHDLATESLAGNDVLGSKFNSQQEDSSKIKRKNSVRVRSRTDSNQMESSEDEGEVVSRDEQSFGTESHPLVLSEDEGQPVTRTGHIEKSNSSVFSEDEGEPVSRYNPQKEEGLPHKRMKVTEDESEGNDDESDRTVIKMDNVVDENIVQNSSVDEFLRLLSNMKMASQEERCLVQTYVEALRKLKGGSTKKGQKKKMKQARKLITELNAELAHIRTTCQKEGANKKVKKQNKKINKPPRSNNEAMEMTETKAGKKRKCDLDCDESDTMKKKGKLSPRSDEQNGTKVPNYSSDNKEGFLAMIKLWQIGLHESSEVTVKGFKYNLCDESKKRKFSKKLKFLKRQFLNGDLSKKECLDAIQSFLSSV